MNCVRDSWAIQISILFLVLLGLEASAEPKQLLWGDTHLHSSNSFDAYLNRNMSADPDTAYRYAKGQPVIHPYHRARVQIETPLDFLVIADHAELLGVMRHIIERGIPKDNLSWTDWFRAHYVEYWLEDVIAEDEGAAAFAAFLPDISSVEEAAANPPAAGFPASDEMSSTVWSEAIRIADAHNDPGEFTTLIGWEWSSIPAGANLHRVVFTSSDANTASQFHPWSSIDSMYPEDLWKWLDRTSAATGAEFIAIPHNSNISKGYMFRDKTLRGQPYDQELAQLRVRWEPVVEATQIKGDSETHPSLSPEDPFAEHESYRFYIQQKPPPYAPKPGDFVRSGLLTGLAIGQKVGSNPFRFGLIGSTDSHSGMASAEEPNFWGKMARDSTPETKASFWRTGTGPNGWSMSAGGLAAVWAEENSRDAILQAFKRREVYATTGPRIGVRVAGSWDEGSSTAESENASGAWPESGVPMGGELSPRANSGALPKFQIQAIKDPKGANLDRIQVIKGWLDVKGETHEQVFDVAWSGDRIAGASGHVPAVGNTVDSETATYTNTIGSPELSGSFADPTFDPSEPAFYYVRVLEIPTPRHSTFDAVALGRDAKQMDPPWWIQERAYTSPIWYQP